MSFTIKKATSDLIFPLVRWAEFKQIRRIGMRDLSGTPLTALIDSDTKHKWVRFQQKTFRFEISHIFTSYCWWKKSQTTTWDVWNPLNKGINYQPQLVSLPDFWTINSIFRWLWKLVKPIQDTSKGPGFGTGEHRSLRYRDDHPCWGGAGCCVGCAVVNENMGCLAMLEVTYIYRYIHVIRYSSYTHTYIYILYLYTVFEI